MVSVAVVVPVAHVMPGCHMAAVLMPGTGAVPGWHTAAVAVAGPGAGAAQLVATPLGLLHGAAAVGLWLLLVLLPVVGHTASAAAEVAAEAAEAVAGTAEASALTASV